MAEGSEVHIVLFEIAGSLYGVDISQVREIIVRQSVTRVPNAPYYIEGVTNLRGKVIPVADLRRRFDLSEQTGSSTHIVVMEIHGGMFGVSADGVREVVRVELKSIRSALETITGGQERYVSGITQIGDRLVVLLDLNLAFSPDEIEASQLLEEVS